MKTPKCNFCGFRTVLINEFNREVFAPPYPKDMSLSNKAYACVLCGKITIEEKKDYWFVTRKK